MNRRPPYTMWADEHGAWALDDLGRDWTLTQSDRELILQFRGEHNRLRAALDLCSLRTTGAFVSQWAKVPLRVVNFMGNQLHLRPLVEPLEASSRRTTSSDHRRALRVHLEFCPYEDVEEGRLRELLYETSPLVHRVTTWAPRK